MERKRAFFEDVHFMEEIMKFKGIRFQGFFPLKNNLGWRIKDFMTSVVVRKL